jgi:triosephosphate isomerase
MLKSIGVNWALAGHSERRTINKESEEYINAQCVMLIENDMNVILCVGETLEEFEKNLVGAVCEIQLKKGLAGINKEEMSRVTIAYEPVWGTFCLLCWFPSSRKLLFSQSLFLFCTAIGTGKVATPEIAQDVHKICRDILKHMYDEDVANDTRILYGGSVSPQSVAGLLAKPDIDGALVGGASLNADSFGSIINFQQLEDKKQKDELRMSLQMN